MKLKTLALSLFIGLAAVSASAEAQYQVRVPANVILAAPEVPQPPEEPIAVMLSHVALPSGTVGMPYSFELRDLLTITGGSGSHNDSETAWTIKAGDALPPGLNLNSFTHKISGTPTESRPSGSSFDLVATYKGVSGQQTYTIIVGGAVLQVSAISSSEGHTCVITTQGAAKCWGRNSAGQLGNKTTTNSNAPVQVDGLTSGVTSISAGEAHTCAVHEGAAKCWGSGLDGRLGSVGTSNKTAPFLVYGLGADVMAVSAGGAHSCAILTNGTIKCWGKGTSGQLGNGGWNTSSNPVAVSDINSGATAVVTGGTHSCAVTSGLLRCWGDNLSGQVGDGQSNSRALPRLVTGMTAGVTSVAAGKNHACAVKAGALYCWGTAENGRLGNNATGGTVRSPVLVSGLSAGVDRVFAGADKTCATMNGGALKCWGRYLGNDVKTPLDITSLNGQVQGVAMGTDHLCASTSEGTQCWGQNSTGQLGDGTNITSNTPVTVSP